MLGNSGVSSPLFFIGVVENNGALPADETTLPSASGAAAAGGEAGAAGAAVAEGEAAASGPAAAAVAMV